MARSSKVLPSSSTRCARQRAKLQIVNKRDIANTLLDMTRISNVLHKVFGSLWQLEGVNVKHFNAKDLANVLHAVFDSLCQAEGMKVQIFNKICDSQCGCWNTCNRSALNLRPGYASFSYNQCLKWASLPMSALASKYVARRDGSVEARPLCDGAKG